jgi:hypothetical protein
MKEDNKIQRNPLPTVILFNISHNKIENNNWSNSFYKNE